jgi:hypothetical protein
VREKRTDGSPRAEDAEPVGSTLIGGLRSPPTANPRRCWAAG